MVSLGVASTLIMVAMSTGARLEMEAEQDRMGRNLFYVRPAELPVSPGRGNGWYVSSRPQAGASALIERGIPAVLHAEPIRERMALIKIDARSVTTTVRGVTPEFFALRNLRESNRAGRFGDDDREALRRVAVLGPFVRERLSDAGSLVGETVRIGGVPFQVIGELRAKGAGSDGSNLDDQILIPFETSMRRLDNVESASLLLVQARDAGAMRPAMNGVREPAAHRSLHRAGRARRFRHSGNASPELRASNEWAMDVGALADPRRRHDRTRWHRRACRDLPQRERAQG